LVVNKNTILDIVSNRRISIKRIPYTLMGSRDAFLHNSKKGLVGTSFGEEVTYYYELKHGGSVFNIAYNLSEDSCVMNSFKMAEKRMIDKLGEQQLDCYKSYMSHDEPNEKNTKEFNECTQKVAKDGESLTKPEASIVNNKVCEGLYNIDLK